MSLFSTKTISRTARRLQSYVQPQGMILVYHRVADLPYDPWGLAVSPANFAEQLAVLRHYNLISLTQLASHLAKGTLPRKFVVLTFDDGYADNLEVALPLLEAANCPATVFLTTGMGKNGFWWDDLAALLLNKGELPAELSVEINGRLQTWPLHLETSYKPKPAHRHWRANQPPPTLRHAAYLDLWHQLHPLPSATQAQIVAKLYHVANRSQAQNSGHRLMTSDEWERLAASPCIGIGAHTVNHPSLAALAISTQTQEITGSQLTLEHQLQRPITTFAYPFGKDRDYNQQTIAALHRAKFTVACTNEKGLVTSQTDRYQLPRMQVKNDDGAAFYRWLQRKWYG